MAAGDNFEASVSGAGDVNGDGYQEILSVPLFNDQVADLSMVNPEIPERSLRSKCGAV